MQVQVQEMIKRDTNMESLDFFVALNSRLDDPYNVFVRLDDLLKNNSLIYFYAYSLGKKKIILWGVFDINSNSFEIDDACKYNANDLKKILDSWKKNNYSYFFASTKNSYSSRLFQDEIFNNRKKENELLEKFKRYFMAKLNKNGLRGNDNKYKDIISQSDFEEKYNEILNTIINDSMKIFQTKKIKEKYSNMLNLIFTNIEFSKDENEVKKILMNFSDEADPYVKNIVKYILVNIFILIFVDFEEYRIAKYIEFLYKNKLESKEINQIKTYIQGSFLYEWIMELGRVLRVIDLNSFLYQYALILIKLTEEIINTTGGIIGGDNTMLQNNLTLNKMSIFFQDFISKSKYSKISLTSNIKLCPNPSSCEIGKEGCELYNFGTKTFSKYDLT